MQVLACLANGDVRGYVTSSPGALSRAIQEKNDLQHLEQVRELVSA